MTVSFLVDLLIWQYIINFKTQNYTNLEHIETEYDGQKEGVLAGAHVTPSTPSEVSRYS